MVCKLMQWLTLTVLLIVCASGATASERSLADKQAQFTDFLNELRQCYDLVGLQVSVTKHGQVVYKNAFGTRDIKSGNPVNNDTLFSVGSCTKSFTAAALEIIHQQKGLDLDTPVHNKDSRVHMKDEFANQRVSFRDMMSHRTGLPRYDLVWLTGPNTTAVQDNFFRFANFEPNNDFRTTWEYNNWMVATAGEVGAESVGMTWQEMLQTMTLDVVGMNKSTLSVEDAINTGNYAVPVVYGRDGKTLVALDPTINDVLEIVGPAGSLNSNAGDMILWVQHLLKGVRGQQLVDVVKPTMPLGSASGMVYPEFPVDSFQLDYGMGTFLATYRGYLWWNHGGDSIGHHSLWSIFPEWDFGSFSTAIGPNVDAVATARMLVAYMAFDIFNDFQPWLNSTNMCNFPCHFIPCPPPQQPLSAAELLEQLASGAAPGPQILRSQDPSDLGLESGRRWQEWQAQQKASGMHPSVAKYSVIRDAPDRVTSAKYTGTFVSKCCGTVEIEADGQGLRGGYNQVQGPVTLYNETVLLIHPTGKYEPALGWEGLAAFVTLDPNTQQAVSLTLPGVNPEAPPVYERQ